MYDLDQTICAVASPAGGLRTIIRVTGPRALEVCGSLVGNAGISQGSRIQQARLVIWGRLAVDARLYVFPGPRSYTGQPTVEIHLEAGLPVARRLIHLLISRGAAHAQPGEFTARAFLSGKMPLSQAEAVNRLIVASTSVQQRAAVRLLQAGPEDLLHAVRGQLIQIMADLEAGIDFPEQEIPVTSRQKVAGAIREATSRLHQALAASSDQQRLSQLQCIGLAGLPNSGKTTLFNRLCKASSLVSPVPGTTRDVVEALLDLGHVQCLVFDCAGLVCGQAGVLDRLAHQAATDALKRTDLILLCVDIAKSEFVSDLQAAADLSDRPVVCVATKADLVEPSQIDRRLGLLASAFGRPFLAVSGVSGLNIGRLYRLLAARLESSYGAQVQDCCPGLLEGQVRQAVELMAQACQSIEDGSDEVAAMLLRLAYQRLSQDYGHLDESILGQIFGRFCIGK